MKKLLMILFSIFALLLLIQCSTTDDKISREIENELALLPEAPVSLAHVNIQDMRNSFIFETMREEIEFSMERDRKFQRFLKKSGLNPLTDFNEVLVSSYNRDCCEQKHALFLVKGTFSPQKLEKYILEKDEDGEIMTSDFEGQKIFSGENKNFGLAFLSEEKLIAGNRDLLEEYITHAKTGKKSRDHQKLLRQVKYKSGSWMVVDTENILKMGSDMLSRMPSQKPAEVLKSLSEMNFSVKFDKEIQVHGFGKFENKEKAEYLKDTAKGMIAAAKLAVSENRDLIDILNKCKIENNGKNIKLNFKLTKKEFETLKNARGDFPQVAAINF